MDSPQPTALQQHKPDLDFYIEQIRSFPDTIAKHFRQRTLRVDRIETELIEDKQTTFVTTEKLEAAIHIGMQQMQLKHGALANWLRYHLLNDTRYGLSQSCKTTSRLQKIFAQSGCFRKH